MPSLFAKSNGSARETQAYDKDLLCLCAYSLLLNEGYISNVMGCTTIDLKTGEEMYTEDWHGLEYKSLWLEIRASHFTSESRPADCIRKKHNLTINETMPSFLELILNRPNPRKERRLVAVDLYPQSDHFAIYRAGEFCNWEDKLVSLGSKYCIDLSQK